MTLHPSQNNTTTCARARHSRHLPPPRCLDDRIAIMAFSKSTRIIILLIIDSIFFLIELITGYAVHSLALVADSFHMVSQPWPPPRALATQLTRVTAKRRSFPLCRALGRQGCLAEDQQQVLHVRLATRRDAGSSCQWRLPRRPLRLHLSGSHSTLCRAPRSCPAEARAHRGLPRTCIKHRRPVPVP